MKRIAKNRPHRLAHALSALASSVRSTVAGRTPGHGAARGITRTGLVPITRSIRASRVAARLTLVPADPAHFDWIARLLREGAAEGSFDRELATDSLASHVFFANLRRALATGNFVEEKADATVQVPASGYVLILPSASRGNLPLGFMLFKSMGGPGFELWLTAVDRRYRGKGFGKAMLQAALATPAGMLAHVARVNRAGRDCEAMGRTLAAAGYRCERDGPDVRWFVRQDAPQALVRLVREGDARLGG